MAKGQKQVVICMGSVSDWSVLERTAKTLEEFGVGYSAKVLSAHRTPHLMLEAAEKFEEEGYQVVIGAAGGAAHLPGMLASITSLPVIGVPIKSKNSIEGIDSLLSIAQMPPGVPVGTMAIGAAENAAIYAITILAVGDPSLREKVHAHKKRLMEKVERMQAELDEKN